MMNKNSSKLVSRGQTANDSGHLQHMGLVVVLFENGWSVDEVKSRYVTRSVRTLSLFFIIVYFFKSSIESGPKIQ